MAKSNNTLLQDVIRLTKVFNEEIEEGATCAEFLKELKGTEFKRKIKSYEYQNGFLAIELE